jgi:prepilin-type N-terminal cleavage/methylation domain-containing protein
VNTTDHSQPSSCVRSGFTLLELLIAIVIIGILAGIAIPAASLVRDSARKASCAANLRQWGISLQNLATDQRNSLPRTPVVGGKVMPRAMFLDYPVSQPEAFSLAGIATYLPNGEAMISSLAAAPIGAAGQPMLKRLPACPGTVSQRELGRDGGLTWMAMGYSYFGRSDLWPAGSGTYAQETFSRRQVDANTILMSETLGRRQGGGGLIAAGHSNSGTVELGDDAGAMQSWRTLKGVNQLKGDGAVQWKSRTGFDVEAMVNDADGASGRVSGEYF